VRIIFEEDGKLGLFKALGMARSDEDESPDEEGGLSVEFVSIDIADSQFSFAREGLEFDVPVINLTDASVAIETQTKLMRIDHLKLPKINFVFHPELMRMDP